MSTVPVPPAARLVLATHNQHKLDELQQILSPLIPGFLPEWVISAGQLHLPEPREDGLSFADNSLLKARAVVQATGLPAVADDSGLSVEVLGGAPGIFSARWCGYHGDDTANLELLLAQLADVPEAGRKAAFVSAAVLALPDGRKYVEIGEMPGTLLYEPRGSGGFGYDPIFVAEGWDISNAQMTPEQKNSLSHRGKSFRGLAPTIAAVVTNKA